MERNVTVDRLKGYACFLVLFGHVIMGIRLAGRVIPCSASNPRSSSRALPSGREKNTAAAFWGENKPCSPLPVYSAGFTWGSNSFTRSNAEEGRSSSPLQVPVG